MDLEDRAWGLQSSSSDLLTASMHEAVASLDPGGTCLTVVV